MVLKIEQSDRLEKVINKIYDKYTAKTNFKDNKIPITNLFEDDFAVYEGNNRHLQVLRYCESEFSRSNRRLTFDELLARAITWNGMHCKGSLPLDEVKKLVKQAMMWISNNNDKKSSIRQNSHEIKKRGER